MTSLLLPLSLALLLSLPLLSLSTILPPVSLDLPWWALPSPLSSLHPKPNSSSADVALAAASTISRFRPSSSFPSTANPQLPRGQKNPHTQSNALVSPNVTTPPRVLSPLAGVTSPPSPTVAPPSAETTGTVLGNSVLDPLTWQCESGLDIFFLFNETLKNIAAARARKSPLRGLKICRRSLKTAAKILKNVKNFLDSGNMPKARNKIRWTLSAVQRCGQVVSTEINSAQEISTEKISKVESLRVERLNLGKLHVENAGSNLTSMLQCLEDLATNVAVSDALTGVPLTSVFTDYGAGNVLQQGNSFTLSYNLSTGEGARIKSVDSFSSGKFSANITCPPAGFTTAFYLATDSSSLSPSAITMEFPASNRRFVKLGTIVSGRPGWTLLVPLNTDCDLEAHIYSIYWTPDVILWKMDNKVLHMYDNRLWECPSPPPGTLLNLYLSLSPPSSSILTPINASSTFNLVSFLSPQLSPPSLPAVTSSSSVYPLGIDYCTEKISILNDAANITFDQSGCGGRFRTARNYKYGEFSGEFKCADGNTSGALSSFYLSSMEGYPSQDEIDFEWLGNNKMGVQTNYYVNGVGGNEVFLSLGFDCSEAFHKYTIRYTESTITWLVDDQVERIVEKDLVPTFPVKSMFLYASLWNASFVLDGGWSGKWSDQDLPHLIQYRDMRVSPLPSTMA